MELGWGLVYVEKHLWRRRWGAAQNIWECFFFFFFFSCKKFGVRLDFLLLCQFILSDLSIEYFLIVTCPFNHTKKIFIFILLVHNNYYM